MTELCLFDQRALETTESIVNKVDAGMTGLPTPCSDWTLGQLLAHMTGQNYGFAAAARGETKDRGVWAGRPVGDDPAAEFAASAADVKAAFAADGVLERSFWLPEVRDGSLFPAPLAISFHFVDYVVHGWDVAATLGIPAEFDADLLDAVLPIAEAVPDGPNRQVAGASFRPGLALAPDASRLDRVLALLGRDPGWSA